SGSTWLLPAPDAATSGGTGRRAGLGMLAGHVHASVRRPPPPPRPRLAATAYLGLRDHADRFLGLALLCDRRPGQVDPRRSRHLGAHAVRGGVGRAADQRAREIG